MGLKILDEILDFITEIKLRGLNIFSELYIFIKKFPIHWFFCEQYQYTIPELL